MTGDPTTGTNEGERTFTLILNGGLVTNLTVSGDYDIQVEMISNDPDPLPPAMPPGGNSDTELAIHRSVSSSTSHQYRCPR